MCKREREGNHCQVLANGSAGGLNLQPQNLRYESFFAQLLCCFPWQPLQLKPGILLSTVSDATLTTSWTTLQSRDFPARFLLPPTPSFQAYLLAYLPAWPKVLQACLDLQLCLHRACSHPAQISTSPPQEYGDEWDATSLPDSWEDWRLHCPAWAWLLLAGRYSGHVKIIHPSRAHERHGDAILAL